MGWVQIRFGFGKGLGWDEVRVWIRVEFERDSGLDKGQI